MGWPALTPEDLRNVLDALMFEANSNSLTLEIYESPDIANWSFPPLVQVPNSTVRAYDFGILGRDEGFSGHCQISEHDFPFDQEASYGWGLRIKYSAEGDASISTDAYIQFDYKVINNLGDLSTAAITSKSFVLPTPALSVEQTIRYLDVGLITSPKLSKDALIIVKIFGRDAELAQDTLDSRLLITEIKPRLMDVVIPP